MIVRPLHIAVNARLLLNGKLEGMGRFSDEVLKRMVALHPEARFSFFFDRKFDERFLYGPNVTGYVLKPPARHPVLWYLWFEFSVKRMLKKLQPDVFFSPDGFACLQTDIPQIIVIHDLGFEHHPEDNRPAHVAYYHKYFPLFAKKAAHIVAVSKFTQQDVVRQYGVDPEKFSVAPNAASEIFHPLPETRQQELRDRLTGGRPYFHYIGALQPRKNLPNLIKAFTIFKSQTSSDAKLLIVGRMAWKYEEMMKVYADSPVKDDIIFTGMVSDQELNAIYGASLALCYVTNFEGFGIQLVEAMRCGCPIITADTTSLPEVAGDAALFADPAAPETIASAMGRIWREPELREELIKKGGKRSELFDWGETAVKIWQKITDLAK